MTQTGSVYGEALYDLAQSEGLSEALLKELTVLAQSFAAEPDFIRLLGTPSLSKQERCKILDDSFKGNVHSYVLNFLKILTEKGHIKEYFACLDAYTRQYNQDNHILPVDAVSAVALSTEQISRLEEKISTLTGKKAQVKNRVDPKCMGGIVLDYDGTQVDGSVASRMENIRKLLKNTVL